MRAHPPTSARFQDIDSAKSFFWPVGKACAWDFPESLHMRKKIWLHYHGIRLAVEIAATLGTAALAGYWIVQSSR